jgi:hypothetical protein
MSHSDDATAKPIRDEYQLTTDAGNKALVTILVALCQMRRQPPLDQEQAKIIEEHGQYECWPPAQGYVDTLRLMIGDCADRVGEVLGRVMSQDSDYEEPKE